MGGLLSIATPIHAQCNPPLELGPDVNLCDGDSLQLSVSPDYASISWSTGATTPSIMASAAGVYGVSITDTNGCMATDSITITIAPVPFPSLGPDQDLCVGDSVTLDAGAGWFAYLWNDSSATTDQDITLTSAVEDLNREVIVRVKNVFDCAGFDTVAVSWHAFPVADLAPVDTTICEPATVTFAVPAGELSYLWNTGDTSSSIQVNNSGSFSVQVTGFPNCVTLSNTAMVTVNEQPDIPMIVDLGTDFQASPLLTGATYTWYVDSVQVNDGTNGTLTHNNVPGIYHVGVTSAQGCPAAGLSDTVQIPVPIVVIDFEEENIPQLITPNGDQMNDDLVITDVDAWPDNELVIVNRYGQEVFKTTGYDNITNVFRGTAENGENLPDGTYYYILDLNDSAYEPFKGFIVISR